ncbi:2-dehydropantoate 2-reductase [Alphaproteobacteria bacterium]|nr:2-dehydropantoate 2-reductase [Alphaproteobacteria bacterium]
MKIAIAGTGAMGSVYAALLSDAGNEVWAVDTWQAHVEEINSTGLRVEGASGDRTVSNLNATTNIADAGLCDLYIIATKADGVGAAAQEISKIMNKDSLILTIQNGLGAGERIAQFISTENVLLGVAEGFGASMKGPGHAHHNSMRQVRLGEMEGGLTDRLKAVEAVWQEAGFNANAFGDIHQLIWEKYICNVFLSAPCTVFDCPIGGILDNQDRLNIALGCMREAYQAGKAKGINFSFDDPDDYAMKFARNMPDASPSMRLDHLAKRKSEIDAINGMVPVVSAEMGLNAPYNETLSAVVRKIEAGF